MWKPLQTIYRRFLAREGMVMVALAVLVGVTTGLGAIGFKKLIHLAHDLFFVYGSGSSGEVVEILRHVAAPTLGGLLVGLLVYHFAREAKGHGVPEVMEAVALRGGRIRPVVAVVKSLASSICIGSGGSAGREGPIVQIGSALGSTIGQVLHLSDKRTRNLLMCGAASGIAATFNTPIAGVFFALEVIAGEFSARTFSTVVIASVVATIVGTGFLGNAPAFEVPTYHLESAWELPLYLVLGGLCAVASTGFIKSLHGLETFFENRVKLPEWARPALGGLCIGLIGLLLPQIHGVGYETIDAALWGRMGMGILALLVLVKILATSLTLGSGGSGGVFAPSLFMGAMLGGAFGLGVNALWPGAVAPSGAYALVAMGALFAGTARAPITAIIILFEMTRDYHIILPLMFACAVSVFLSRWMSRESIYHIKLKSRGIDLESEKETEVLDTITVGEAMKPVKRLTTISPEMPLEGMARLFRDTFHHGYAVTEDDGKLFGVITLQDLERSVASGRADRKVRDVCTRRLVTAFPDETLDDVLRCFGALDVGRIPVVSRKDGKTLVGMLRWSDIVRSRSQILLDLHYEPGTTLLRCDIAEGDRAVGRSLRNLNLPSDFVIHYIHRSKHMLVPRGDTVLESGDQLVILASVGREEEVNQYLYGESSEESTD